MQTTTIPENCTIGIGILSWKAYDTLTSSLESYQANDFLSFFDQKMIYFSDISEQDTLIAKRFGWEFSGGANQGISGGMRKLAEHMNTDYVILLQNDNPLIESPDFTIKHIKDGLNLLLQKKADIVRLRHQWHVGEGFSDVKKYLRYFPCQNPSTFFQPEYHGIKPKDYKDSLVKKFRRIFRPLKANRLTGRSIFIERNPEKIYPEVIKKEDEFLFIDSSAIHFSDQCLFLSRKFFLDVLIDYTDKNPSSRKPNGFQAPEICINGAWWKNKHYTIAQGTGVFTHARKDGSFRIEHQAYDALMDKT